MNKTVGQVWRPGGLIAEWFGALIGPTSVEALLSMTMEELFHLCRFIG